MSAELITNSVAVDQWAAWFDDCSLVSQTCRAGYEMCKRLMFKICTSDLCPLDDLNLIFRFSHWVPIAKLYTSFHLALVNWFSSLSTHSRFDSRKLSTHRRPKYISTTLIRSKNNLSPFFCIPSILQIFITETTEFFMNHIYDTYMTNLILEWAINVTGRR